MLLSLDCDLTGLGASTFNQMVPSDASHTIPSHKQDCGAVRWLSTSIMSITEIASLELIPPYTLEEPDPSFVKFIGLTDQQVEWSGYPLRFFTNPAKPSEIYLITGWKDVVSHLKWIASDQNQALLRGFGQFIKVNGMVHVDMDFSSMPTDETAFVLEKYAPSAWPESGKDGELGEKKAVHWTSDGKDLDPKAEGAHYRLRSYTGEQRGDFIGSSTDEKEITILRALDVKALGRDVVG